MSLNSDNFISAASKGARVRGKQFFNYDSDTDPLGTVLASGYFDGIFGQLEAGDIINIIHPGGVAVIEVAAITAGVVTSSLVEGGESGVQALTSAGAADLLTAVTEVTSDGANVITLANGLYIGQKKTIILIAIGTSAIVTPATTLGVWSTITLLVVGDTCQLIWNGTGWSALGVGAGTVNLPVFA